MKGQFSVEYIIAITLFVSFVFYIFFNMLKYLPAYSGAVSAEFVRSEAYQISELLLNDQGEPTVWYIYNNTVGSWRFEENIGTIVNDSYGINNGNYSGETFNDGTIYGATRVDGKFGKGLSFDGVNDYVNVPSSPSLEINSQMTITAWIKPFAQQNWNTIIQRQWIYTGSFWFGLDFNGLEFGLKNDIDGEVRARYDTSLTLGQWYFVVATYDGSAMTVYLNGQAGTPMTQQGTFSNFGNYMIGVHSSYSWFNGTIDEVRIYNRSLSEAEIQAEMNSYRPMNRTIAAWSFEESGQYANDTHIWVKGKYGSALNFDGVNDYVNLSSINLPTTAITVTLWIKASSYSSTTWTKFINTGPTSTMGIIGGQGELGQDTWFLELTWDVQAVWEAVDISQLVGKWKFVAIGWNGTHAFGGADGSWDLLGTSGINPDWAGKPLTLGATHDGEENFNGTIDEVRIYNRALTQEEILVDYQSTGVTKRIGLADENSEGMNMLSMQKIGVLKSKCPAGGYDEDVKNLVGTDRQFSLFIKNKVDESLLLDCHPQQVIPRAVNMSIKRIVALDTGDYGELVFQMW